MPDIQDYARAILSSDEGRKKIAYKDTKGLWTVGVGRNLEQKPLSDAEIDLMLQTDVDEAISWLMKRAGWSFLNGIQFGSSQTLNQCQYHVFSVHHQSA